MTSRFRTMFADLVNFDREHSRRPALLVAGVDEAGRGALAGPVVAAAVICDPCEELTGVRDSKLLTEPVREELYELVTSRSIAWGVGIVRPAEIDRINILRATLKAMRIAIENLDPSPGLVLVDGGHLPDVDVPAEAVKGGDRKSFAIAAASIVAKVTRDRIMRAREALYPGYGFGRNKGYGTREHVRAIGERGRTRFHRRTFRVKCGL